MEIDERVAVVTVICVDPLTPDSVAEMELVPVASAVASPREPAALEMATALPFDEAQVTDAVRF
jgi:hypothetical protein